MNQIPHQLTANVKLLHKIAIEFEGKVLILKRSSESKSRPNCWDLPGGNSEWPEEGTQSGFDLHTTDIVREIEEETGIQVNKLQFSESSLVYFHTYFDADKQIYTIICGWSLSIASNPVITLSSEHQEFKWVKSSEVDSFDFGVKAGDFVKAIIKQSRE